MRAAILGVDKLALLPAPLLAKATSEEYLDPDMRVPGPNGGLEPVQVDWALVNGWRDAVSRLDASKNHSRMTACRDSILSVDRGNGGVDVSAAELFRY